MGEVRNEVCLVIRRPYNGDYQYLIGQQKGKGNHYGLINGGIEPDDDGPEQSALRELHEEASLVADPQDIILVDVLYQSDKSDSSKIGQEIFLFAIEVAADCQGVPGSDIASLHWLTEQQIINNRFTPQQGGIKAHHVNRLQLAIRYWPHRNQVEQPPLYHSEENSGQHQAIDFPANYPLPHL